MQIDDQVNKVIAGTTLTTHLQNELQAFAASAAGGALLNPILLPASNFEVVIKTGAPTATFRERVTISPKETKIDRATTLADLKEFVESTIFELTNASNSAAFATLETDVRAGTISPMAYGRSKSDHEAQASWNVFQLLTARAGYVPSAWGQKHVTACQQNGVGGRLANFQQFFSTQPHDVNEKNPAVPGSLPSREYYAFTGTVNIVATRAGLDQVLPDVMLDGKRLYLDKLKNALPQAERNFAPQSQIPCCRFYQVLVDLLAAHTGGAQVVWPHGGLVNWQFTAAMKTAAPDTGGLWAGHLTRWLTNKNKEMFVKPS